MTDIVVEWEVTEGRSAVTSVPPGMPAAEMDKAAQQVARDMSAEGAVVGKVRWYLAPERVEVK